MKRRHQGVALITALLVVSLATLAAAALLSSSSLAIHRTAGLRDSEQAWWVARGVEAWVLGILKTDDNESQYDGEDEDWAQPVDYLPVDQGFVSGRVHDLQGRLNLNNLNLSPKNRKSIEQFKRLLGSLPDQDAPPGLLDAIVDWSDGDANPSSMNGAEDTDYLNLTPPYRAANRPFTVVSELLAVRGMTPKLYAYLQPLVAALPVEASGPTRINVNTAPPEVLRALSDTVDEGKLGLWIGQRKENPVTNGDELQKLINDGPWPAGSDVKDQLTWRSDYFQIQGEVFVGSSRVALYSLIQRQARKMPVVLAHSAEAE